MRDNFQENISRTFSITFQCGWKDVIRKRSLENIFEALWGAEWTENTWLAKMGISDWFHSQAIISLGFVFTIYSIYSKYEPKR